MSINSIEGKIRALKAVEAELAELNAEAEAIRAELKNEMNDRAVEELEVGQFIIRFTSVLSTRFDTKRFKEVFGEELYKAYYGGILWISLQIPSKN